MKLSVNILTLSLEVRALKEGALIQDFLFLQFISFKSFVIVFLLNWESVKGMMS